MFFGLQRQTRLFSPLFFLFLFFGAALALEGCSHSDQLKPKVVVISMFEVDGIVPGEAQTWIEKENLSQQIAIDGLDDPFYYNKDSGIGLIITHEATGNSAGAVMALGLSPKLDLRDSFFLVAGIAGGPPDRTSLGGAFWADWLVDFDLSHQVAQSELPAGYASLMAFCQGREDFKTFCGQGGTVEYQVYQVNPALVKRAFELTKDLTLKDSAAAAAYRKLYPEKTAQRPPFVGIGTQLAAANYWHGAGWESMAKTWVDGWTRGQGVYTTTAMEDTGTFRSLERLEKSGRLHKSRALVLRAVSNYDRPHPGQNPIQSFQSSSGGFPLSTYNAWVVGSKVAHDILENFDAWVDLSNQS